MNGDEMIDVNLKRSGYVTMPAAYLTWLDQAGLVTAFDSWWSDRRNSGVHGDAFTPFAEQHLAPVTVQRCLKRLT